MIDLPKLKAAAERARHERDVVGMPASLVREIVAALSDPAVAGKLVRQ